MHRKRLILFLTIGLSIFLAPPLLNMALRVKMAVEPIVPADLEQLWAMDSIEGGVAMASWLCCDISLHRGDTLLGDNGYMFLGNNHDSVIDKITGRNEPAQPVIETWTTSIKNLSVHIENLGASFVFALAPNKHSIYPDYLPQSVVPATETTTDRVIASARHQGLAVLDLRQPLRDLRSTAQVYLRTDTHWSNAGAALAYTQMMAFLGAKSELSPSPLTFEMTEIKRPSGDLAAFLKVGPFLGENHEIDYALVYEPNNFCIGQMHLGTETAQPCKIQQSGAVGIGRNNRFFIKSQNDGAPNDQTVLMICDSFCAAHSGLFNASFKTVYHIHWLQLNGQLLKQGIARIKPDIVIFQVAERGLLQPDLAVN